MFSNVESGLIKRSPLELGFVTFPEIGEHKRLIIINKPNVETNNNRSKINLTSRISHSHEWIPGRIKHHAYVPAPLHHIFIPLLIPVSRLAATLQYELYPKHFGSQSGGQGAGHGYQIFFNN